MNYTLELHNNHFSLRPIEAVTEKCRKNKINQSLIDACKLGRFEKVISLIEDENADLHLSDLATCLKFNPPGNNPLHIAAANGFNDIVEYLILQSTNIHSLNKRLSTPLHSAVFKGRTDTVKLLLKYGASIEVQEDEGDTPLSWAAYTGFSKIVELLIEHGANIHNKNKMNYTPLHWACYTGHLNSVKILIQNGADLHFKNNLSETPIDCALNCGRDEVYAYLARVISKKPSLRLITANK